MRNAPRWLWLLTRDGALVALCSCAVAAFCVWCWAWYQRTGVAWLIFSAGLAACVWLAVGVGWLAWLRRVRP